MSSDWKVLLIGGNSGAGKTTVARELSRHFGIPWLQVDDFRLVLQHNVGMENNPELHHFDDLSTVYRNAPKPLAAWRAETAKVTSRAIEVVVANHASFGGPVILEGDDLVPRLASQQRFAGLDVDDGDVRAVFLIENDEAAIESNMVERDRGFTARREVERRNQVRMSRLFGAWLEQEAGRLQLPVVRPHPWETLTERVLRAIQ